jgi:hypothetical protein
LEEREGWREKEGEIGGLRLRICVLAAVMRELNTEREGG